MEKQKNKFIIFIIIFVVCILCMQVIISLAFQKEDTNSYALLLEWNAVLNEKEVKKEQREILHEWDTIITWGDSFLIIEWWDGSISRIWENTEIKIEENFVGKELSEIRIGVRIFSWKMWSKVVSLIGENSYFHSYFYDIEAWVRGTTFNIDLENDTIFVEDHEILIENDAWESMHISEDEAFSIRNFSLIDLEVFIKNLQDIDWNKLNKKLDSELILQAKEKFYAYMKRQESVYRFFSLFSKEHSFLSDLEKNEDIEKLKSKIKDLSDKEKNNLYKKLYSQYQRIHISSAEEKELYEKKMDYKSLLMILSESEDTKKALVSSTLFDIEDMKKNETKEAFKKSINFLIENKETLQSMNINLLDFIDIFSLPDWLKEVFKENLDSLKGIFMDGFKFENFSLEWVWESVKNINDTAQDTLHKWLDTIYDILTPE